MQAKCFPEFRELTQQMNEPEGRLWVPLHLVKGKPDRKVANVGLTSEVRTFCETTLLSLWSQS